MYFSFLVNALIYLIALDSVAARNFEAARANDTGGSQWGFAYGPGRCAEKSLTAAFFCLNSSSIPSILEERSSFAATREIESLSVAPQITCHVVLLFLPPCTTKSTMVASRGVVHLFQLLGRLNDGTGSYCVLIKRRLDDSRGGTGLVHV